MFESQLFKLIQISQFINDNKLKCSNTTNYIRLPGTPRALGLRENINGYHNLRVPQYCWLFFLEWRSNFKQLQLFETPRRSNKNEQFKLQAIQILTD